MLGGILSSVGSSLLSGLSDFTGGWLQNSAKESLNKNIGQTNVKIQKQYDLWTQEQDKAYEKWFQDFMYGLQNNQYYNLAKKYATNTASWAVEGLKRAGLNPILAGIDSNLSSSMGNANPTNSGHSTGGGSVRGASVSTSSPSHSVDLASAVQKHAAAEQAQSSSEQTKVQTEISKATKDDLVSQAHSQAVNTGLSSSQISASTAESLARAKLIDAQADETRAKTEKVKIDTGNAERNSGLNGTAGAVMRTTREFGDAIDRTLKHTSELLRSSSEGSTGIYSDKPSSARSMSGGHKLQYNPYEKIPEIKVLHDGERAFLPPSKAKYDWHKKNSDK